MKVLISAYSCGPNAGTEPGHGWGTATYLARQGMDVHVLTQLENEVKIEPFLLANPIPRLSFSYVDHPLRKHAGQGLRYLIWQWLALRHAQQLHRLEKFDLAHHVTFGSIHVPTQLWQLGIPVVFGPVGGGQTAPESMLGYFAGDKKKEQIRTLFTKAIAYSPLHRYWLSKMSTVLVANRDTFNLARSLGRQDARMMFDTIIPDSFPAAAPRRFSDIPNPLKILWVGRMLPRKGLVLSLDILAKVKCQATLTIVGNGIDETTVRKMISDRGLTDKVFWQNRRLPWDEVRASYLGHDVMLFNSLRETGGAQLVEAMALGLPIVTLNLHGPRDLIPDAAGLKVDVKNPQQVIDDMAATIDGFSELAGDKRSEMSRAGWEFAQSLTYSGRAKQLVELYGQLLSEAHPQESEFEPVAPAR